MSAFGRFLSINTVGRTSALGGAVQRHSLKAFRASVVNIEGHEAK